MKRTLPFISGWRLAVGLLIAASIVACSKDPTETDPADRATRSQTADLIASLGYDTRDLTKLDDGYLVEGDIWLTDAWLADARERPATRLTQLGGGQLVAPMYQNKLFLNPSATISPTVFWERPIEEAIDQWNSISEKCYIDIAASYSDTRQEIGIAFADKWSFDNSTKTLMKVTPPGYDGKPGRILINSDHPSLPRFDAITATNETYLKKARYVIMHAIGHALGLGHTLTIPANTEIDPEWGGQIKGTESYDNASIMCRETSPLSWSGFSTADKKDIPIVFPRPDLEPGSIEETKTISAVGGTFSIRSVSEASGGDEIVYRWEKRSGDAWVVLDGQTGKDLADAPVPQELTSEYRREARNDYATGYSNICVVTNDMFRPLTPGRIEEQLIVDASSPDTPLRIASLEAALCPRSAVTYRWERSTPAGWVAIPDSNTASLAAAAPMAFSTHYRRTATCAHESACSNECIVYNRAFLNGGEIPDTVEIHKTGFVIELEIPSLRPAPGDAPQYTWEYFDNGIWTACDYGETLHTIRTGGPFVYQRNTRLRRRAETPIGPVWTAECMLIDYAIPEDPTLGTHPDKRLDLGCYSTSFTTSAVIDTNGPDFYDYDRFNSGGNEAFLKIEITEKMMVEFLTISVQMGVWLDVWRNEPFEVVWQNRSSYQPLLDWWTGGSFIPYPSFDAPDSHCPPVILMLEPGQYELQIQGIKSTNGGTGNGVMFIEVHGTTASPIIPSHP